MKKLKGSSNYLKNQVRKNLAKAALCIFLFCVLLFTSILSFVYSLAPHLLELAGLALSLAPLGAFYYYLRKYRIYSGGWAGEKQVAKLLNSSLSNDYFLLNDFHMRNGGGDIDHIVLSPSGVFVLETKNWSGAIACNGDNWQRTGKHNFKGSPSLQVKRNAAKIRQIFDASPSLRSLNIWVEGIVVFTNKHATLRLNGPTVTVLKIDQLPSYIKSHGRTGGYSETQLEAVGKEILKQKS